MPPVTISPLSPLLHPSCHMSPQALSLNSPIRSAWMDMEKKQAQHGGVVNVCQRPHNETIQRRSDAPVHGSV